MGAGASAGGAAAPFESAEAAIAAGKTQEEVDGWMAEQAKAAAAAAAAAGAAPAEEGAAAAAEGATPAEAEAASAEGAAAEAATAEGETKTAAEAAPAETAAAAVGADGVDRSEIERNANGSEEPSSADPELWNIDNCEVDILVKYKMGGQMWYVQSRMRENTAKDPAMPVPGFPMNKKAEDAKRFYAKEDVEYNKDSTNFCKAAGWKEIEAANPPVTA